MRCAGVGAGTYASPGCCPVAQPSCEAYAVLTAAPGLACVPGLSQCMAASCISRTHAALYVLGVAGWAGVAHLEFVVSLKACACCTSCSNRLDVQLCHAGGSVGLVRRIAHMCMWTRVPGVACWQLTRSLESVHTRVCCTTCASIECLFCCLGSDSMCSLGYL